jgi:chemotaxis protein CheX
MQQIAREEIVRMIQESTDAVFSTMLQLEAQPEPSRLEQGEPAPVDGVVALVGIAGPWTGTGRIYCSPEFARMLAGALLMTEFAAVDADVLDAVAEVANMVIGNLKTALEAQLGPLALSVPTVIYGRNYQARTAKIHDWIVVPFRCQSQSMDIRFCLTPTPVTPNTRVHRPEPAAV